MTPEQKIIAKLAMVLAILTTVFFTGFGVRGYMAQHELTEIQLKAKQDENVLLDQHIKDLKGLADTNAALRNQVHRLDVQHTGVLNEKLAENSRLRADLVTAQRLSLRGTTCPRPDPGSDLAGTGSVGDGAAVMLSGATGLAVFDLRESLIRDRQKLAYLQDERRTLTCSRTQKNPG